MGRGEECMCEVRMVEGVCVKIIIACGFYM